MANIIRAMFRVIILSKQYNVAGPPGGRVCARHFIYASSSHAHGHSKRQVMVNLVVKKLRKSEQPETSKPPMSGPRVRTQAI